MTNLEDGVVGILELHPQRGGFLRSSKHNYAVRPADALVPRALIQKFRLVGGEMISGSVRMEKSKRGRTATLSGVTEINGKDPEDWVERVPFADLTAISPERRIRFETTGGPATMRIVDLMAPIGFGQRALIVAPPRTGKTVLLQQMAHGIAKNHPDAYMLVLLIDERPEEVTDMRRTIHGEVVASSNDHETASHVRIARLMMESAKRRLEGGEDVIVILDSLTRLGRAFNSFIRGAGRIMSGGLDIRALEEPKVIFGAARNIESGGSLTIIASALIETGSRMDEVIFNEFKGTGNMELVLSRELADRRVWPAIDLRPSGTRKEELLLTPQELDKSTKIRRVLLDRQPVEAIEGLLKQMGRHESNEKFIASLDGV